ncbi:hypothetical protein [Legionella tucsonensis]|uniref:Transmembrane protein n=1 Tax=Legionella tucsonensis TaxID=40335 RepID=A0A0W0ZSS8_9GAMM|nr:hypothetical protein [Legionella tucsonensis]KTD72257.1 hypothetical protein Ltuc_0104 [Legionella tucsonensis]
MDFEKFNIRISLPTVTLLSIFLFYTIVVFYAFEIFYQFTFLEIISTSIVFLILLICTYSLFCRGFITQKLDITLINIFVSILVVLFLIDLGSSFIHPCLDYARTYPLLETELGLNYHRDTVFHVSIIQSILNFGYASTAQHGTPVLNYHVLSHYIDALIIFLTKVDPYDSYGMFFYFKIWLFLSSIVLFLFDVCINNKSLFFLALLAIAPLLVGRYSSVLSHGLWFTSIIIMFSSVKVHKIFIAKENQAKEFVFLFFLVVVVALGKVSSGFVYALIIGTYLLLKNPKSLHIYVLAFSWILFFFFYQKWLTTSESPFANLNTFLANPVSSFFHNIKALIIYLTEIQNSLTLPTIYTTIVTLVLIACLFPRKQNSILLLSGIGVTLLVYEVTHIRNDLIPADIYYFEFGLLFILTLFTVQFLACQTKDTHGINVDTSNIKLFILSWWFLLSFFCTKPNIAALGEHIKSANNTPFLFINRDYKKINLHTPISFTQVLTNHFRLENLFQNKPRPLFDFKNTLASFMKKNELTKKDSVLFIPQEIYEKDLDIFAGDVWARGLLIYAVTGIPLVHGVHSIFQYYGFKDYSKKALWVNKLDGLNTACKDSIGKNVILVKNFKQPTFSVYQCIPSKRVTL